MNDPHQHDTGYLRAKIAELEERLSTVGGRHREQMSEAENRIVRQAKIIQEREDRIQQLLDEIKEWRHKLDHNANEFRRALEDCQSEESIEQEIDAAVQQEREATQAICEANYRIELEKALTNERTHFEALKEAVLAGQRAVMLHEFDLQTQKMIQLLEAHYAERYHELEERHRKYREEQVAAATQQVKEADFQEYRSVVNGLTAEILRLREENDRLLKPPASGETR